MTRNRAIALVALGLLALGACATNPTTGERGFTGFMSPEQEARIGRGEHPKILLEFGGAYRDPALRDYVARIGQRLAAVSEMPDLGFTFTVLNSDIVNAFALPGGYVYVTTGLLALAGSEAELAGVLGHEIGHITARHSAQRYSRAVLAPLGTGLVGAATGSQGLAETGAVLAQGVLAGYSREQESEADILGTRYLARAGYDTGAMAGFLAKMEGYSVFTDALAGRSDGDRYSLFATHPRTAARVEDAIRVARIDYPPPADPGIGVEDYLRRIDGLYYGGDPANGFVRDRQFVHPGLGFRFVVPRGFQVFNGSTAVTAIGSDGARIVFDLAPQAGDWSAADYIVRVWAPGLRFQRFDTFTVDGLPAATGTARIDSGRGPLDMRLVAVKAGRDKTYRFLFVSPPGATAALDPGFRGTVASFREMTETEATRAEPFRVRVRAVRPGETAQGLAAGMPFDSYRVERFLVLNGLAPGARLERGQWVKVIDD
ncbi:MAG: M48 family metalloprotease [Rhodospirillaceae bacterium]|jgi:predicted Zn-dependent protease|nr:M48 family metalloprotease [Rhodospirillaceae bacterium]